MNRREFLRMLGVTGAGAFLASCERPTKLISRILPTDENVLPGDAVRVRTTCTECPAGCGVIAKVRNGHPVKLEGNPRHPLNRGALCMRGQASLSRLYLPNRLRTPLMKATDGQWVPVEWEAAFARISAELDGSQKHLFLSGRTSGALSEVVDRFCARRGVERMPEYEFYSHAATRRANQIVFGQPAVPAYRIREADLLLSVGADLVETYLNPVQCAVDLAANERLRWIHVEPHFSLTGNHADERWTIRPGSEPYLLAFLADELDVPAEDVERETGLKIEQLQALAADLQNARAPLLIVGGVATATESGLLTAVLAALVEARYDMPGKTVDLARGPDYRRVGAPADLAETEEALGAGDVGALFVHQADPVAYRPAFGGAMGKASFRVGLGDLLTATMEACDLVLPLSHSLECWGEEEGSDGVRSLVQPATQPLHQTRSAGDILLALAGDRKSFQEYLTARWGDEQQALIEKGFVQLSRPGPRTDVQTAGVREYLAKAELKPAAKGRTVVVVPSLRTFDGRSDALPLLSEIPDTLAAISYGEFVLVSPADAASLGVTDKDVISVGLAPLAAGRAGTGVELPVRVQPALPAGVFVVQQPFLRGMEIPCDPLSGETLAVLPLQSVAVTQRQAPVPVLSGSMDAQGRGIQPEHNHDHEKEHGKEHAAGTLYPEHQHQSYRWAMAIDLDRCTGCGACVAACYVENNIALVGPDEHLAGREMSWIRLEPFTNGEGNLDLVPMMCQHCDHAPCEPVCPVLATYHNPEGLNAQIYNRCVGTRYCANNCPYKVRRFNWVDHPLEKPQKLMLNPDVSQRPKGVMEKCTFCIQRITRAKDHAKDEGRLVQDGEITTACAETCPGQAIVFGNLLDNDSRVFARSQDERAYRALEELGTQPAVYYLKKKSRPEGVSQA